MAGESHTCNAVGFTSQITAAFRAVELQHSTAPVIRDPLAPHLGKAAAYETAYRDWQQLVALQGPGKSLRVPARNRLVDDLLLAALQQLSSSHPVVQIVNIGCGMDSKPWRLQMPCKVHYFDVDQPGVIQAKQQGLQEAGAATMPAQQQEEQQQGDGQQDNSAAASDQAATQFPLLVGSWRPVAADLSQVSLSSCLEGCGFDRSLPTVWLAEALLYYLTLDQAFQLLADMRALSASGSMLVATCIDKELHIADHQRLEAGHYFHAMWHFSLDEMLLGDQGQRLHQQAGWTLQMQPQTTAALALERYGRQTYVPTYGGAEAVFTAGAADGDGAAVA